MDFVAVYVPLKGTVVQEGSPDDLVQSFLYLIIESRSSRIKFFSLRLDQYLDEGLMRM